MTTVLVSLVLVPDRSDDVLARLRGEVAPWLRRLPGFVTSRWLLTEDHDRCTVLVEMARDDAFDSLSTALAADEPHPARSWQCERIEVVTDLGLAAGPAIGL
jgi:hypothetical protein